jgi:hypothetical protein
MLVFNSFVIWNDSYKQASHQVQKLIFLGVIDRAIIDGKSQTTATINARENE